MSEFYATCNNVISNTINTTHLVISEDRKLLHTFKSKFVLSQYIKSSGYVAASYLSVVGCIKRACVCVTGKCKFKYGQDTDSNIPL